MQDGQQPGWVFKPGGSPSAEEQQNRPQEFPQQAEEPQPIEDQTVQRTEFSGEQVEWTASEYISNPKSSSWFGALMFGSVVLSVIGYLVTRDIFSVVVIMMAGILFAVFAARHPRTLRYVLDDRGMQIGEKFYSYELFKSFSVATEHAVGFVSLAPLKRFMPPLTIHYPPEDEDRIVSILADHLPYKEHQLDIVDNITRRIKF